jgi:hypothetical protein
MASLARLDPPARPLDAGTVAAAFLLADALKPGPQEHFAELLVRAETAAARLPVGAEALALIHWRPRADLYARLAWTEQLLPLEQLRVWPEMGGIPLASCHGSVVDVAARLHQDGIPAGSHLHEFIRLTAEEAERERIVCWLSRLPLIAFSGAALASSEQYAFAWSASEHATAFALDDGSHRGLLLSLLGTTHARVFVGDLA